MSSCILYLFLAASYVAGFVDPSNDKQQTVQTTKLQICGAESINACSDYDHLDPEKLTRDCCEHPNVFHCQESTDERGHVRTTVACVPNVTCSAGTHALLLREKTNGILYAWVFCKKCGSGFYEDTSKDSYLFRNDHCSREKTICLQQYNKSRCYDGGAAEDDKCRCMHETNCAPSPMIPECFCFDVNSVKCHRACSRIDCPDGETLNERYQCETRTIHDNDSSRAEDRGSDKTDMNKPVRDNETKINESGDENLKRSSEKDERSISDQRRRKREMEEVPRKLWMYTAVLLFIGIASAVIIGVLHLTIWQENTME